MKHAANSKKFKPGLFLYQKKREIHESYVVDTDPKLNIPRAALRQHRALI